MRADTCSLHMGTGPLITEADTDIPLQDGTGGRELADTGSHSKEARRPDQIPRGRQCSPCGHRRTGTLPATKDPVLLLGSGLLDLLLHPWDRHSLT